MRDETLLYETSPQPMSSAMRSMKFGFEGAATVMLLARSDDGESAIEERDGPDGDWWRSR